MHKRPAFDCTRDQHPPDFRGFSPGCPLLGALLPRRASSRSPDRTPAEGGLGRARVVSWGRAHRSKRRPHPLNGTALLSPHYPCQKYTVHLSFISRREYPICTSLIFLRLHAPYPFCPYNPPSSRTPNLSTVVSSANRAVLRMPDRTYFVAKSFPCTATAVVVDSGVNNKHVCAETKINNIAHQQLDQVQTKFPVSTAVCCIYYCCTDSRSIFSPFENGGST